MQEAFDPITRGHVNVIERALSFCDKLIVVIGINKAKKTLFDLDARIDFIQSATCDTRVTADSTEGLIIEYAKQHKANVLIRGVRSVKDFEYETALAQINKELAPTIETVLLPALPIYQNISSSMVKELASFQVDVRNFVSKEVAEALSDRFADDIL